MTRSALPLALLAIALSCGLDAGTAECPSQRPAGCPTLPDDQQIQDGLVHLARADGDTFIEILDLLTLDGLVYACTATQGLTIWDANGDDAPDLLIENVGPSGLANVSFPRCQHIEIDPSTRLALLTNRGDEVQPRPWLWLYDLSDPGAPRSLGGWDGERSIEGVSFDADALRVHAAAHVDGILTFEVVADGLQLVGQFADADSDAWLPRVLPSPSGSADRLVVAEGKSGLRVYDVAGDVPLPVASLALQGSARDFVLDGDVAYVATATGIASVDLSNPDAPRLIAERGVSGSSLAVELGDDDLLLVAEWDRIRAYDRGDPASLETVLSETVPTGAAFSRVLTLAADPGRRRVYAGEWQGMHAYEQNTPAVAPDAHASPQTLQFPNVAKDSRSDKVLLVENRGNAAMTFIDVATPHPTLTTNAKCSVLGPGERAAVEVSYEAANGFELTGELRVCTDDPDDPELVVPVSANAQGRGVGDRVPAFALRDLDGELWSSRSLEGNILVLAYFATF